MATPTLTGDPSIDFVLQALPDMIGMLPLQSAPVLAVVARALEDAVAAVEAAIKAKGFDPATAIAAADAASDAAETAKFGPGKP